MKNSCCELCFIFRDEKAGIKACGDKECKCHKPEQSRYGWGEPKGTILCNPDIHADIIKRAVASDREKLALEVEGLKNPFEGKDFRDGFEICRSETAALIRKS